MWIFRYPQMKWDKKQEVQSINQSIYILDIIDTKGVLTIIIPMRIFNAFDEFFVKKKTNKKRIWRTEFAFLNIIFLYSLLFKNNSEPFAVISNMSGSGKSILGLWLYRSGEQEWAVKQGSPLHKRKNHLVRVNKTLHEEALLATTKVVYN